jgi:hypothetical protein
MVVLFIQQDETKENNDHAYIPSEMLFGSGIQKPWLLMCCEPLNSKLGGQTV